MILSDKKSKSIANSSSFWLIITFFIIILVIIGRLCIRNKNNHLNIIKNNHCHHQDYKNKEGRDALLFLHQWECDYCQKIAAKEEKYRGYQTEIKLLSLMEKHLAGCIKAQEVFNFIDAKKVNGLTYDNEETLKSKGYYFNRKTEKIPENYQSQTINQIKNWGLVNRVILPNLQEEKRTGVVNTLAVSNLYGRNEKGEIYDEIIFQVPSSTGINHQNLLELLNKRNNSMFFSMHGSEEKRTWERIFISFFLWRTLSKKIGQDLNNSFYILSNHKDSHSGKYTAKSGPSGTLSLYLSLLSSYYQKPISKEVAATGSIEIGNYSQFNDCLWCLQEEIIKNQEQNFSKNKIVAISGLEYKILAAKEAGVKKIILSIEQKEDYERTISEELKKQLKVYYVSSVEKLEALFWQGEFS